MNDLSKRITPPGCGGGFFGSRSLDSGNCRIHETVFITVNVKGISPPLGGVNRAVQENCITEQPMVEKLAL